jgi:hypothetical protein
MTIDEILDEFCAFASYRAFHLGEVADFAGRGVDRDAVRASLLADSRFTCLGSESPGKDYFVLDSTLFLWFIRLNMRLTEIGLFRLTESQVAALVPPDDLEHLQRLRKVGPEGGLASLAGGWEGSEELVQLLEASPRVGQRDVASLD